MKPDRPILRWFGGKYRLSEWIISHFPEHRVYVEPFGGAASVLMAKTPSWNEVYNDLDKSVVTLMRVLRSKAKTKDLLRLLEFTPYSREEFINSYNDKGDGEVERARKLIIRSYMGHGSDSMNMRGTAFRGQSNRSNTSPASDWVNYRAAIPQFTERLSRVVIENDEAMKVMEKNDTPETLHYLDPPYPMEVRASQRHSYIHEMTDFQHLKLIDFIQDLKGMVIVSGYPQSIYGTSLLNRGWQQVTVDARADRGDRVEAMWLNSRALGREKQMSLFEGGSDEQRDPQDSRYLQGSPL